VAAGRDPLDLSLAANAADNTFGSGVVVDARGSVLTPYHVIQGARKIFLRYSDGHGTYADIHAADARSDLAVLKPLSPPREAKAVRTSAIRTWDERGGKATVFRGQSVLALAHPLALGFNDGKASASTGIIANVRRRAANLSDETRTGPLHQYANLLQTDARLAVGASGGGLFNSEGELIGLLNATAALAASETAGGYAVPMDANFIRIIDVLKQGREVEYGFLGVSPDPSSAVRRNGGLLLSRVSAGTPADAVGIRQNDMIVAVDGRPVADADDLFLLVGAALADTEVSLTLDRRGQALRVKPKLAKFFHTMPSIASVKPASVHGLRVEFTSLIANQPIFFGERQGITPGVLIRDLEPDSPAARKLKAFTEGKRMTITEVNGVAVKSPAEFYAEAKKARTVALTLAASVNAQGESTTVSLP
jgi:serine protease Do